MKKSRRVQGRLRRPLVEPKAGQSRRSTAAPTPDLPPGPAGIAEGYALSIEDSLTDLLHYNRAAVEPFVAWAVASALGEVAGMAAKFAEPVWERVTRLPQDVQINLMMTAQDAGALAVWRRDKTVMVIDPDLWSELRDTPQDQMIPAGLLDRLPYPDPFVALPSPFLIPMDNDLTMRVRGFYVTGRMAIGDGIVIARGSTGQPSLGPATYQILMGGEIVNPDGSVVMMNHVARPDMIWTRFTITDGKTVEEMVDVCRARFVSVAEDNTNWNEYLPQMFARVISLLLYMCAENADLRTKPGPPPRRAKTGRTVRRTAEHRVIEVGFHVGAALREYRRAPASARPSVPTGRHVRPHVRRSHPHLYWTGPGKTVPKIRWVFPIRINMPTVAAVPTTHDVTKKGK